MQRFMDEEAEVSKDSLWMEQLWNLETFLYIESFFYSNFDASDSSRDRMCIHL